MHIVEEEQYKVACHIDRLDLRHRGITPEDLMNRTPLGNMFIRDTAKLATESTDYQWPGCGMTMQIDIFETEIVLYFSERIEDYVYNLKQSANALDEQQADDVLQLVWLIESQPTEDEARNIIRSFEENIKMMKNQ